MPIQTQPIALDCMRLVVEVIVWRGTVAEARHRVQVALSTCEGVLEAGTRDAHLATTFRSAAKPFQLLPLVERGHAKRWQWSDEQLAVMAASHTGSPYHVALVSGILDRLQLTDQALACDFHEPLDPVSREHLRLRPEARSALYNNCSGKHAGMLCLALSEGWPSSGYHQAEHPVQQLMRRTVAETCGVSTESMAVAVDGCNVSVFGLPLAAMARGYARLSAANDSESSAVEAQRERALARIRKAMQSFPGAVGGAGRLSTALMEATQGRLVAKGGAEGLECIGLPARGLGLAVKCEDGHARAMGPAVIAVLEHLHALEAHELEPLREWSHPTVRNHAARAVGSIEPQVRELVSGSLESDT
jgi:L-asparaginase II